MAGVGPIPVYQESYLYKSKKFRKLKKSESLSAKVPNKIVLFSNQPSFPYLSPRKRKKEKILDVNPDLWRYIPPWVIHLFTLGQLNVSQFK